MTAFCFDLDGTLTTKEILPILAKEIDLYEEINILTNITMQGLIPFENSFKLRVKLLSSIDIKVIQEIISNVPVDENLLKFVRANQSNCYIVTGNLAIWVGPFIEKVFGCEFFSSRAILRDGHIEGLNSIIDKGECVRSLRDKYDKIVVVGDGMNDSSMFLESDISIAYGGTHQPSATLRSLANYIVYDSKSLLRLLENLA